MKVSEYQINAVIKTYVKNSKERLSNHQETDKRDMGDVVNISEAGKRILYERMRNHLMHRMQTEIPFKKEGNG